MVARREKVEAAAILFAVCLAWFGPASAQDVVDVTITNYGFGDLRIEVSDGICGGDLFEGFLIGDATITVNACAGADGTAAIVIAHPLTGTVNRYDGLTSGANIRLRVSRAWAG